MCTNVFVLIILSTVQYYVLYCTSTIPNPAAIKMLNGPIQTYSVLCDRSSGQDRTDRGPRSRVMQQDRVKTDIGPIYRSFFLILDFNGLIPDFNSLIRIGQRV